MNTQPSPANQEHDTVRELLPWYVRQNLTPSDQARVERHLGNCPDCADALAQDVALAQLFDQRAEPVWQPSEAHFERLMAMIDADAGLAEAPADAPEPDTRRAVRQQPRRSSDWLEWLRALPNAIRWTLALETFAIAGLAMALILPRMAPEPSEPGLFQTYSQETAPTPADAGPRLRVVFAPTTQVADVLTLTRSVSAQIVAGPSALGVYTLELGAGQTAEAAIKTLRGNAQVVLAEPVTAP